MTRRLVATVIGGAAVFGVSVGVAGGLIAVGIVRRFGPAPARPGGAQMRQNQGESAEVFAARVAAEVRNRARMKW